MLEAQNDTEKQVVQLLERGLESGEVRPELVRGILERRTETHDAAQEVMAVVEPGETTGEQAQPESAESANEHPAEQPATTKPSIFMPLLSKSPHSPEHRKYLERVAGEALPNVRRSFENGGIVLPTDDEILQQMVMTERFTPEEVANFIKYIQETGLIVLPPQMKSFSDYERLLNANKKRRNQLDVYVSPSRRQAFAKEDEAVATIERYKFGIGELTPEPENRRGRLRSIIEDFLRSDLGQALPSATPRGHAALQAQAEYLLDLNGWSMLSKENDPRKLIGEDNLVSGGDGCNRWTGEVRVGFRERNPGHGCDSARVRSALVK